VIKAHDKNDAVIKLKEEYGLIVDIKEVASLDLFKKDIGKGQSHRQGYRPHVSAVFHSSHGGTSDSQNSGACRRGGQRNKALKHILASVAEDVNRADIAWRAVSRRELKTCRSAFIETIRAGEESGSLEDGVRQD